jgi:DNA-binding GntR family transcriptional regulator
MPQYKTEAQKVYEAIKEAILSGRFAPGDRLPQRRIAEEFDATTITVREALRSLETEGLVVIEPKWGAMVEEITPDKMFGRYVVREALEGMAARLASRNITSTIQEELLERARELDRELIRDDLSPHKKAHIHHQLHKRIAELTQCDELRSLLNKINLHTIILSNAYHIDWHTYDADWHQYLVKAIISGDQDLAERTMRLHVQRGYEMEMKALERDAASAAGRLTQPLGRGARLHPRAD